MYDEPAPSPIDQIEIEINDPREEPTGPEERSTYNPDDSF